MSDFFLFWLCKPVVELAIALAVGLLVMLIYFLIQLPGLFRQAFCNHEGRYSETMSCDAICCDCGKNIGFIGAWRERQRAKEQS